MLPPSVVVGRRYAGTFVFSLAEEAHVTYRQPVPPASLEAMTGSAWGHAGNVVAVQIESEQTSMMHAAGESRLQWTPPALHVAHQCRLSMPFLHAASPRRLSMFAFPVTVSECGA